MKLFRSFLIGLGLGLAATGLYGQTGFSEASAPDSIIQLAAETRGLPLVSPTDLPKLGTYWEVLPSRDGGLLVPAPCPPENVSAPIYRISGNIFLADATAGQNIGTNAVLADAAAVVNLIEQVQTPKIQRRAQTLALTGGPTPPGAGTGGTNVYYPNGNNYTPPDYGTNLWLAQIQLTNGDLTGIASNTLADVPYEILTNGDLTTTNWGSTGWFVPGSEATNWTALPPLPVSGTDNRFFKLRSWIDSENVGIPDWWQLQFFGYVGIDPYALSPSGDGFDLWQKYQAGLNPADFETPPAPANFYAVLSTNGTDMLLSWSAAQGTVANYDLLRVIYRPASDSYDYSNLTVNAGVTSWVDAGVIHPGDAVGNVFYTLTAVYPGGNTSQAAYASVYDTASEIPPPPAPAYNIAVSARLVRNGAGRWQLMFPALPPNAQSINLLWTDTSGNTAVQNISTNALTNGVYQVPDADAVSYLGDINSVQGVGANGELGVIAPAGVLANDAPYFVDGRQHLKQNLEFLIRGASMNHHFGINLFDYRFCESATNFEEFSFLSHDSFYGFVPFVVLDDLWPFTANYQLSNYLLDTNTYDQYYPPNNRFSFEPNFAIKIPAPPILDKADPYWIMAPDFNMVSNSFSGIFPNTTDWGVWIFNDTNGISVTVALESGIDNFFSLPYESGCVVARPEYELVNGMNGQPYPITNICHALPVGNEVTFPNSSDDFTIGSYASWCSTPVLQLTNYYFAPLINPDANTLDLPSVEEQPLPLPVDDTFNTTNQTPPVIIAAVGEPVIIGGWAKYAIQESSPAKYAYLGQYFETNAFLLDGGGHATTTNAGVLSPYGEFFPTQAGKAQLITLPDMDAPHQQGTCTVSIVSLTVDANHDGAMDLSYFGPDQTSPGKPYVFWVNNDFDRWHSVDLTDHEQDDLTPQATPDYNYTDAGGRAIPCTRDLEDFSRLWINGVTTNLLASLPAGSTVTLNWGDAGSPNYGNPTIDLFQAADADGGIGYLTNSATATVQTNNTQSWFIGRLAPGGSLQLNAIQFNDFWAGDHFIWCGVTNGSGKLTLTFADAGGHVLGQASVYLQIKDIKQMYERWTVGDDGDQPPLTTARMVEHGFHYGPATTNTPYILHVHGWNMFSWEKDRFAETEFKRLWWQGYQGRFGEFRWPTYAGFPLGEFSSQAVNPRNFDNSESNAWASAVGLLNKLTDLNTQYPGHVYLTAHSMGNVVVGEALRLAGNTQVVNTYIAMQGAVSAHAYDSTTANRPGTFSTPDDYASYWNTGAPYFSGSAGAGIYVNFFNTNDYALHSSDFSWEVDQNDKPDHGVAGFSIPYPGYYYNVSSLHPNGFYAQLGSGTNDYRNFNFPGDTYTIFSYCDQSRSRALGAEAGVAGIFSTSKQVDLSGSLYGFGSAHKFHSGEFRSDNEQRWQFWQTVLVQMGLKNE